MTSGTSKNIFGQSSRRGHLAPPLIAAVLAAVVYTVTLRGTYIYDDLPVARDDARLTHPSLWKQYWTRTYMAAPDRLYRPLVSLSFALQRTLWGQSPWQFHLLNVLLHAAVAAAVAELGLRLAGTPVAWFAGILFALHPAHVEAVAGIVGRCELACALATLCGLCVFLGRPLNGWRVALISLCGALALLSKEQGLLFPLLLLALLPFRTRRGLAPGERKAIRVLAAAICYITAGYVVLREYTVGFWWDRTFLSWEMNPLVRAHALNTVLKPIELIGRYLGLLIAPHRQSLDYGAYAIGWKVGWPDWYFLLGAVALVLWAAAVVWSLRARRWAAFFCLIALALTYGMIGNIAALIGTIFADRLIYLPSAFFLLLVGMALARMPRAVAIPIVAVLAVIAAWRTVNYASVWNSPRELFALCVRNQPGSERGYDLLFTELKHNGQWAAARDVGIAAVQAVPDSDRPYAMCIESDVALGNPAEARKFYDSGMNACSGFDRLFLVMEGSKLAAPSTRPSRPD